MSDNDFWETYTPAFKSVIKNAGVYSLMCAYNAFENESCCSNDYLLNTLLRKQWGFKGFIVTDCGAVTNMYKKGAHEKVETAEEAAARAIKAGVDLECGSAFNALDKAVEQKLLLESDIDNALRRLFTARFLLGAFDDANKNEFTKIPYSVVESKEHIQLALEAARKSIVLLKNEGNILPLKKSISTIAVIGPNANDAEVLLANYNGTPSNVITPFQGLQAALPLSKIIFSQGSPHATGLPVITPLPSTYLFADEAATIHGLQASYYNNIKLTGQPIIEKIDTAIHFNWIENAPFENMDPYQFSVQWKGFLKPTEDGAYYIDMSGSNFECILNDTLLFKFNSEHGTEHKYKKVFLKAGKMYAITIICKSTSANATLQLNWEKIGNNYEADAIATAAQAEVVVLCMGLSPRMEGEEMDVKLDGFNKGDRVKIDLPDVQQSLIKKIAALGKPIILVMLNGSAVAINWEKENVAAIIETWYGGQQAGTAIADVIIGKYNPSGRLPITFYTSETELPAFENYDMKGRTYRYYTGKPLYEFGYGLSYTQFTYSNLVVKSTNAVGSKVQVTVTIQNTGNVDGEEVAQLYISNLQKTALTPVHCLKGFTKIFIKKGEKKRISFTLHPKDFSNINTNSKRVVNAGSFTIAVGGKQPTFYQKGNVVTSNITFIGKEKIIEL